MGDAHTQVTIRTPRSTETFSFCDEAYQVVAERVRSLLTIEVFPYWPGEAIHLSWTSTDSRIRAVLFGMALAWQLIKVENYDER